MKPRKSLIALTSLALVLPLALHAQQPSDPILGTWVLNVAKSKFESGPAPRSETLTYVQTREGIDVTDQVVAANGDVHVMEQTYDLDGKTAVPAAPPGGPSYHLFTVNPYYTSVRQTQVSRFVAKGNLVFLMRMQPQTVGQRTQVESMDGKTLTLDSKLTTRAGQSVHDVTVFDRR